MKKVVKLSAVILVAASLTACGQTTEKQAIYGAAAGAVGSQVLGANVLLGTAVGAAANVFYCDEHPGKC